MRIAFLIGRLQPGGAELALLGLADGLARRGHDVRVFTLFARRAGHEMLGPAPRVRYIPLADEQSSHAPLVLVQLLAGWWRLRRWLRRDPQDVLYSGLSIANVIAALAVRGGDTALVWSVHAARAAVGRIDPIAIRCSAALTRRPHLGIAVGAASRDFYRASGVAPARFEVVPNGIDAARFAPDSAARAAQRRQWGIGPDDVVVGVVARVSPVKAPERFIAAFARAAAAAPRLQGIWVGDGAPDYLASLGAQVGQLGLGSRLRFVGGTLLTPAAYNGFDVFAFLSHSEGQGIALIEAMATALPCVVATSAAPDVIGDTGLLVDGDDAPAVAAALLSLLADPVRRQRLGSAARARVLTHFTVERSLDRTEALLNDAVRAARP